MFQQMEKKKQENKMRRDQLNDQYLELLEKQRLYFKTVKEFKEVRGGLGQACKALGAGRGRGGIENEFSGFPLVHNSRLAA